MYTAAISGATPSLFQIAVSENINVKQRTTNRLYLFIVECDKMRRLKAKLKTAQAL